MAANNFTFVTKFILLGLIHNAELKVALFVLFLSIYALTLVGNLGMIFLIQITPTLHSPMHFFFSCLSFVDAYYSSVIRPKMLISFPVVRQNISFSACIVQRLFYGVFITTESFLLSVMDYDYVAIVNPLLYAVAMSKRNCVGLVTESFIGGMINLLTHTISFGRLSFCRSNVISHFFSDVPPLLKLSCSDTSMNELLLRTFSGVIAMATFLIVIFSYTFIAATILRAHSAEGRQKTFSTCASNLTTVTIFFGTLSFNSIQPSSQCSVEQEKVVSVFYTLVIPMLSPLIYSMRNKEVKGAVKSVIEIKHLSC